MVRKSESRYPLQHRWGARHPVFPLVSGILALLVYLGIAWFVLPLQAVWSPDEGAKFLQLQSLRLEDSRLAYDIPYYGRELDPDLQFAQFHPSLGFLRVRNDALYYPRLPVFPLLVLPLFRWFRFRGLYLLPAIGGAVSSALAPQLLERNNRRLAMWMLIAFGSPVFIYATIFWEHTLTTSLGLASAWLGLRIGPVKGMASFRRRLGWAAVGAMLGISIYIRLEMVLFALALLFAYWFIVRDWGPIWAGASLGLMLFPYGLLHRAMNADFLFYFYPLRYLAHAEWRVLPDLLVGPPQHGAIDPGWLGGLWAIATVIATAHSFGPTKSHTEYKLQLIGIGITAVVGAIFLFKSAFYRSAHGILFTTPWALLGLCRAREVWQRGNWRAQVVVLSTMLGLIGYIIGLISWRAPYHGASGGLEWGARYVMTFYPLLALIAGWDLGVSRRRIETLAVVGALVFLGLGFQVRGIWTIQHDKQINRALNEVIVEMPEQHIVSDLWWIPFNAAPTDTQKVLFVAPTPEKLANWVELAATHQVRRFCLVTLDYALLGNVTQILDEHRLSVLEAHRLDNLLIFRVIIEPAEPH